MANWHKLSLLSGSLLILALDGCRLPPPPLAPLPRNTVRVLERPAVVNHWRYHYYPEVEVYFSPFSNLYFYLDNDSWVSAAILPPHIRINLNNYEPVEIEDERPWRHHQETLRNYPPEKYRHNDNRRGERDSDDRERHYQRYDRELRERRQQQERLERERDERDRREQEARARERQRQELERRELERREQERLENGRRENDRREQEARERERHDREARDQDRQRREQDLREKERLEKERAEKERHDRDSRDQERQRREQEQREKERLEKERPDRERHDRDSRDQEHPRRETDQHEKERLEKDRGERGQGERTGAKSKKTPEQSGPNWLRQEKSDQTVEQANEKPATTSNTPEESRDRSIREGWGLRH